MNLLPSLRLLGLLAATAPLFLLDGGIALAADALILAAAALDALRIPAPDRVRIERDAPAQLSLGESAEVRLSVESTAERPLRLRLTDDVRPPLVREGDDARELRLRAGGCADVSYRVLARERGEAVIGDIHLRVLGPLGLVWRQRREPRRDEIRIQPGLLEVRRWRLLGLRDRLREQGLRSVRERGGGTAFESLREYVRGDDPRRIDWKATAKRGAPILRQYEAERSQNVLLAIDAGRLMTERIGGRARVDWALSAAMLLADVAALQGDRVGVLVFSDEVEQFLPPSRRASARLATMFAHVEARLVEPDYPAAFTYLLRKLRRRSLLVLFTDIIDAHASSAMMAHLAAAARRHVPLAVTLRNPALEAAAAGAAEDESAVYRRAAAEELLQARAQALVRMRRGGVLVAGIGGFVAQTEDIGGFAARGHAQDPRARARRRRRGRGRVGRLPPRGGRGAAAGTGAGARPHAPERRARRGRAAGGRGLGGREPVSRSEAEGAGVGARPFTWPVTKRKRPNSGGGRNVPGSVSFKPGVRCIHGAANENRVADA